MEFRAHDTYEDPRSEILHRDVFGDAKMTPRLFFGRPGGEILDVGCIFRYKNERRARSLDGRKAKSLIGDEFGDAIMSTTLAI